MSAYDKKLAEGARPFLEEGEEVLAAFIARPHAGVRIGQTVPE